jgi:hypothetical protein
VNNDEAVLAIENLFKEIVPHIFVAQKKWSVNITRVTDSNNYFTKQNEWAIDIDFSDWSKNDNNELFVPLVSWLVVRESKQSKNETGVFAARNFEKNEVIGLFYGQIITEEIPSEYAKQTKYGVFDPLRGFADSGSVTKYTMAMHLIIEVNNKLLINARMDPNNFLVQATKTIAIGEEIFVAKRAPLNKKKNPIDPEALNREKNRINTQKRREIMEDKEIISYLIKDASLAYVNKELLANETSFCTYFDIKKYEEKVESDHDSFENILGKLWESIHAEVYYAQKGWLLNVTRESHKDKFFTRLDEWAIDIDFSKWIKEDVGNNSVPMVSWLMVHESNQKKDKMGVFAARKFEKAEVIGLFYGSKPANQPSKYALQTNHGVFDPLTGLEDGGHLTSFMAMHHVIEVEDIGLVNARMSPNLLVHATKVIEIGEEILFKHDTNEVKHV